MDGYLLSIPKQVRQLRAVCVKLRTETMVQMARTVFANLLENRKALLEQRAEEAAEKVAMHGCTKILSDLELSLPHFCIYDHLCSLRSQIT